MKILTYDEVQNQGAREVIKRIEKWLIIYETLPYNLKDEYLKKKVNELKKQYE